MSNTDSQVLIFVGYLFFSCAIGTEFETWQGFAIFGISMVAHGLLTTTMKYLNKR